MVVDEMEWNDQTRVMMWGGGTERAKMDCKGCHVPVGHIYFPRLAFLCIRLYGILGETTRFKFLLCARYLCKDRRQFTKVHKLSKKRLLKISQKVEAWLQRRCVPKRTAPQRAQDDKSVTEAGHCLAAASMPFLAAGRSLPFHVHTLLCPRSATVVAAACCWERQMVNTLMVRPFLSPALCVCSWDCLLSFVPVEFSKARISLPLATQTAYSMFDVCNIKQVLVLAVQK